MKLPIESVEQLKQLDTAEIIEGYWEGRNNEPEPGGNRSLSFWHGWRNGMMDFGHMKPDLASGQLARECIETGYLKSIQVQLTTHIQQGYGMTEKEIAFNYANKLLENASLDPDSDECVLARQYLRVIEAIQTVYDNWEPKSDE